MSAYLGDLVEFEPPGRMHIGRVVVRRVTDFVKPDLAGNNLFCDFHRGSPSGSPSIVSQGTREAF